MPLPLLEVPPQATSDDIDEEILEIFVEECDEVLQEISSSYSVWKNNASNKEALQTLRRAFHTLKGSGRLVGAMAIGELGWAFESLLNRVLDGTISPNSLMFKLLDQVEDMIPPMIEQFKEAQPPLYPAILLISQANHLIETKGAELGEFEPPTGAVAEGVSAPVSEPELAEEAAEEPAAVTAFAADEAETLPELAELEDLGVAAELEAFADDSAELASLDDLDAAFMAASEATEAAEVELVSAAQEDEDDRPDPALREIFRSEAIGHLRTLKNFIIRCRQHPPCVADEEVFRAVHTINGSARNMGFPVISALAGSMEAYMRNAVESQIHLDKDVVALYIETGKLLESLLAHDEQNYDRVLHQRLVGRWRELYRQVAPEDEDDLDREALAAALAAERAAAEALAAKSPPAPPPRTPVKPAVMETEAAEAADEFMEIFLEEAEEILETSQSLVGRWLASPNSMPLLKELQRELHTLKGGSRMVGISAMGDLSHQLESVLTKIVEGNAQSNPTLQALVQESLDELAAMLEAVRSGVALEPAQELIEQIAHSLGGEAAAAPVAAASSSRTQETPKPVSLETSADETKGEEEVAVATAPSGGEPAEGGENEERIRVRASLIDKLTNLAGEFSIIRAHLEQQQGAVKGNLSEMEQTVTRLRDQLRRLEIETEAQIISHFRDQPQQPDEEEFDPLEMDRFSGMQQLSRSLMESVADLQNIQENLRRLTRESDSLLIQQSRIGTDLRDGILRTRMVPFAQITPRLQRIARLTAKELHKQAQFSVSDDSLEFERSVLNRVVAPLEHMLRNAIGHGVELPEARAKAGKPSVARIHIDLSQEGTELVLRLSDDGAGLNLDAIRAKAEHRGLLEPGQEISDQDLMQFILQPAFSTAETITQVSGRGVGMDIAVSEIKQLGGALLIFSERGKGTTFEIRIPTSLTISKSLLVHLAEETLAVPLGNVDAIMRVPRDQVEGGPAEKPHYYDYMGRSYKVAHLTDLLGFGHLASVDSALLPILLVRSGEQCMALVVDGIEGSKEVVVKPVGSQLGTINWIAGATILGDGRVVIILDILTLIRFNLSRRGDHHLPRPSLELEIPKVRPKTIMVVDDSITVRKVTARLLKRQGMEVVTAKDGVDAVAQLQDLIPDLMLLDVEMPRMDGFELATQIRNDDKLKHLPIIMITSRTGTKHRERAQKIGIDRHLGKPFNEPELLQNIKELLAEREQAKR